MEIKKSRRYDIDLLKGLAILVVVFYHLGVLESGYLGVDVFFVIAGFLTVPKIIRQINEKQFSLVKFVWSRVMRLLPAVLIGSAVCLVIGYFFWLPDDYENLSQSVIASTAFSNNILSAITTKNYWDSINDYKPLMHMWYLGILMQFYVAFPIIAWILNKISKFINKNSTKVICVGCGILSVVSLVMFFLPNVTVGDRFYMPQFRFYELMAGGLVGMCVSEMPCLNNSNQKTRGWISGVSLAFIVLLLMIDVFTFDFSSIGVQSAVIGAEEKSNALLLPNTALVPLTVLFTSVFLLVSGNIKWFNKLRVLPAIGKRSFSIFVYHQIILAIYRYSVSTALTVAFLVGFAVILCLLSELNYRFVEMKITSKKLPSVIVAVCACLICAYSGYIYIHAGTVRDVPELGISADSAYRGMHAGYCDRIYGYNKDFTTDDKLKILILGNSFARDFGNILLESEYKDEVEISYSFDFKESLVNRIKEADRIFIFGDKNAVPDYLWENVKDKDIVYGIGTKNFGEINGQVYFNRFKEDYYEQTVEFNPAYMDTNEKLKAQWKEKYIDMIDILKTDNRIRVFTDTNMFISQDTRHLTQAGAQYYAKLLNLHELLY